MEPVKLTQFSHGSGCGCKVAPSVLADILQKSGKQLLPNGLDKSKLLVGNETNDDAAVYDLGNGQWEIPKLRSLLEEILKQNSNFNDFEVEHHFPGIGKKKMLLNARRLKFEGDEGEMILLAMEEVPRR